MSSMQRMSGSRPEPVIVEVGISEDRVRIRPERVHVRVGQSVRWVFIMGQSENVESAELYFQSDSPFSWHMLAMRLALREGFDDVTQVPTRPGEYKYGVRILDADNRVVDDDDPWLLVSE